MSGEHSAEKVAGLTITAATATTWNGGICGVCAVQYLGSHTCSVESLLERSDQLRRLAMEAFERLNPQPTTGPPGKGENAVADLDDALCDALMAVRHGKYDGMTAETHLEHLIERVRANDSPSRRDKPMPDAEKDVLGPFAEAHDFTCSACGRVGGRVGVDDDEWQQVGDALICAPCVLPPETTQP